MTNTNKQRILVTGGAGYIGSHACKALALAGSEPIAYDNLANGHRSAVRWGPLAEGDISGRPRLDEVLDAYRPQAVMHFASFCYVGESMDDPGKYSFALFQCRGSGRRRRGWRRP